MRTSVGVDISPSLPQPIHQSPCATSFAETDRLVDLFTDEVDHQLVGLAEALCPSAERKERGRDGRGRRLANHDAGGCESTRQPYAPEATGAVAPRQGRPQTVNELWLPQELPHPIDVDT